MNPLPWARGRCPCLSYKGVESAQRFGNIRHPHLAAGGFRNIVLRCVDFRAIAGTERGFRFLPAFDFDAGADDGFLARNRLA